MTERYSGLKQSIPVLVTGFPPTSTLGKGAEAPLNIQGYRDDPIQFQHHQIADL